MTIIRSFLSASNLLSKLNCIHLHAVISTDLFECQNKHKFNDASQTVDTRERSGRRGMRGRIIVLVLTSPPVVSLISSYSRAKSWWACALAPHFITPLSTLWIGFVQQERFFPATVLAKRSYYGAKTVADGRTIIRRAEAIISAAWCCESASDGE